MALREGGRARPALGGKPAPEPPSQGAEEGADGSECGSPTETFEEGDGGGATAEEVVGVALPAGTDGASGGGAGVEFL